GLHMEGYNIRRLRTIAKKGRVRRYTAYTKLELLRLLGKGGGGCINVVISHTTEIIGHLDGGCAKKVNEEVAGDDNSFVHTVSGKENSRSVKKMSDSMGSCRLKKSGMPRTGGSILSFMEEVVKVGQTMGYYMDGCVKDITEIIKSQGEFGVHR
nr:RNA-directed DNA polymerase, eukaryota [Tanacetum cinerariifolium]